jgi:NAD(P)H dehydrogenase (quinone)
VDERPDQAGRNETHRTVKVLLVHAHPVPQSFNGALTGVALKTLTEAGHDVAVSDLYAMRFTATASAEDFSDRLDPDCFRLDREQTHAHENGSTAAEIAAEQAKLARADLLVLQYPMWWFGRVLTRGFAYLPGRKYDTGLLRGKVAVVSVTTGTSADTYAPDGIDGAIADILWPVHNGVLRYCGFAVAEPFVTHMPGRITATERATQLDRWAECLRGIADRPRLFFRPREDYGRDERLRPSVRARSGFQHNG